jgi:hypothetical protein
MEFKNMRTYEQAEKIQDKVENMKLSELLSLNPTMRDMYHVNQVLLMGYGKGPQDLEHDFTAVEKLLKGKKHRVQKLINVELREFLRVLKMWHDESGFGPSSLALVFDDDRTFKEHLDELVQHIK